MEGTARIGQGCQRAAPDRQGLARQDELQSLLRQGPILANRRIVWQEGTFRGNADDDLDALAAPGGEVERQSLARIVLDAGAQKLHHRMVQRASPGAKSSYLPGGLHAQIAVGI